MGLARVGFVPIPPGDSPGFDHADVAPEAGRLFVAHTGADRIDVLDHRSQTWLRSITDVPGVAGVLVDEGHDLLCSTDRAAARISVFRLSDEGLVARVEVGPHPNGVAYDRRRRRLHVFNLGEPLGEGCTVSVVDVAEARVLAELPLPGRPRWAVYDEGRDAVYANIRDPAVVVVVDCERVELARSIPVAAAGPHGLWLHRGILYCAADEGTLVALDADGGETIASLPLPGTPDVVMLDPGRRRLYVSIGDPGLVSSFDSERLEHVEDVKTERGAHTSCLAPDGTLHVFCPESCGAALYAER